MKVYHKYNGKWLLLLSDSTQEVCERVAKSHSERTKEQCVVVNHKSEIKNDSITTE